MSIPDLKTWLAERMKQEQEYEHLAANQSRYAHAMIHSERYHTLALVLTRIQEGEKDEG